MLAIKQKRRNLNALPTGIFPGVPSTARKPVERVDPTILVTANGTFREVGRLGRLRGSDRHRTLMRHTRLALTLSMGLLALAMFLPTCLRGLVSTPCRPQLLLPQSLSTDLAAIASAAVTTRTDSKKRVASRVRAPTQAKAFSASIGFRCFRHSHHNTPYPDDRTNADDSRLRCR